MEENLLGYLLGALDGAEHDEIEEKVSRDSGLRDELAALEEKLAPLQAARWDYDPPDGLAQRTCQLVADRSAAGELAVQPASRDQVSDGYEAVGSNAGREWTLFDVVIAAGIFFAAALLFVPAVAQSRHQAQLLQCQKKLGVLGQSLAQFAEMTNGWFPSIPSTGPYSVAGCYAPQLMNAQLVNDHSDFVCPGSTLWKQVHIFQVPSQDELTQAPRHRVIFLQRTMGGSFAYNLGYVENGQYQPLRDRGRSYYPIMSDTPHLTTEGHVSQNHGGRGQNVLFEAGNVRFVTSQTIDQESQDNIFLNDVGEIEAGLHADDVVIGHSAARPSKFRPFEIRLHFKFKRQAPRDDD